MRHNDTRRPTADTRSSAPVSQDNARGRNRFSSYLSLSLSTTYTYIYIPIYLYIYIIVLQVTQVAASMVERCPWIRGYRGETIEWKEGRGGLIRLSGEFLLFLTRKNARLVSSNGEIKREGGAEGEVGVSGVY